MTISAGIDVGSTTIKVAVLEHGVISRWDSAPAASHPLETANSLLQEVDARASLCATGYGRDLIASDREVPTISEIKAHALGARFLFPQCRSVIDIGGQDVKVVSIDTTGKISRFEMNDRCAAGTGKFLDIMAHRLNLSISDFCALALKGSDEARISSLCTVFAESEIVGLLNRGRAIEDIARGLHRSVINRIVTMFGRVEAQGPTVVTGGGAKNAALIEMFRGSLPTEVVVSEFSPIAGAIGCALAARA